MAALARVTGALFLGAVLACSSADQDLSDAIERVVQRGEGTVVNFSEITDFTWHRLHIFPPYTPVEQIHDELGFRWSHASRTEIERLDHFTLLVFTTNREVVRFVEHPRDAGDFAYLHREDGYTPEDAVFVVREEDHGGPWLVIRPLDSEPAAHSKPHHVRALEESGRSTRFAARITATYAWSCRSRHDPARLSGAANGPRLLHDAPARR